MRRYLISTLCLAAPLAVAISATPAQAAPIQVTVPAGATSGRVILQVNNVSLYALQDFVVE